MPNKTHQSVALSDMGENSRGIITSIHGDTRFISRIVSIGLTPRTSSCPVYGTCLHGWGCLWYTRIGYPQPASIRLGAIMGNPLRQQGGRLLPADFAHARLYRLPYRIIDILKFFTIKYKGPGKICQVPLQ